MGESPELQQEKRGVGDPNPPRTHSADDEISGEEIAERMADEPERTSADQAPEETHEGQQQSG